jgi:beta-lactamase class A
MWPMLLGLIFAAEPAPTLAERLEPLARAHQGRVAIAAKNLETGESWYYQADEVMPTASLIKLPVLIETYLQADAGKLKLRDMVVLREEDKVPGSGILTNHFSAGASFPLRDAVRLMVAFSDNTATNLVLDRVGLEAVNKRLADWGYKETRINAKVFRGSTTSVDKERSRRFGLGSTTAREMIQLLEELQTGTQLRPASKQVVLGLLRRNEDKDKFTRLLPPGTRVAHKDGSLEESRTDAGLIETPTGIVAVCVLTTGNKDRRWESDNAGNLLCAKVARAVYDHFSAR